MKSFWRNKLLLLTLTIAYCGGSLKAQHLAAFTDPLDHFWVIEAGSFTQLEHLTVQEYQVGSNLVAYIDNGSNLKVYNYGDIETLITGNPIKFTATDHLLGYSLYQQLFVYDNGRVLNLSNECSDYLVSDSLIVWHNRMSRTIQVYYDGRKYTIEDGLIYNPLQGFEMGDNNFVYLQRSTQQLKLFQYGAIQILDDYVEKPVYQAGRDIVAFLDPSEQGFKIFYKGEIIELEVFQPKSFLVGDERVAWVDNLGHLKYFSDGKSQTISNYEPDKYELIDNVLVFQEQRQFKTVCNNQVYTVERFVPQAYEIDFNTIAYIDQNNFVRLFQYCKNQTISYDRVKSIDLIRDLVMFTQGINKTKIYFNGRVYEK